MAYRHSYLFSINPNTPPLMQVQPGEEFQVEVLGSLAEVPDVKTIPTPFTPECEGHPLTPIAGPIIVRGAEPGDAVAIDLLEITPRVDGVTAILKQFGVLKEEFAEPRALACPVRDGKAWFADRIPIPLHPNLGTISTMPPDGYKPSYAGAYGGDFDQKDVGVGSRVHLPVIHPGAQVFFADPHAVISDGIISGTGIECSALVRSRIGLSKGVKLDRPIIEQADTIQVLGWGPDGRGGDRGCLARLGRFRRRPHRSHARGGLHAAGHRGRAARRHLAAAGDVRAADDPAPRARSGRHAAGGLSSSAAAVKFSCADATRAGPATFLHVTRGASR
jgi:amidase